ncbi:MAG: creatininase family protein [Anaerolineales bacterium]|nr:creatininase family protein [Anaerolineales bacterium]
MDIVEGTMRFEDLNWFDLEKYLEQDDRLMIVLGACEQHAYLSLTTDVKIPLALADAASKQTGVLVAPPVNFGSSPYFLSYPGTLSLRLTTLLDLIEDVVRSAYGQGFKRILVLNGHGGNDAVRGRLYELANQLPDLCVAWYAWWQSHSVGEVVQKSGHKPAHANWLEAFQFTRVAELPEGGKAPPNVPSLLSAINTRDLYGDGSFGGPYTVEKHILDEIFNVALEDVMYLLRFD